MWNEEIFTSLTSLLVSLLDHQQRWTASAEVTIAKQHCLQICQLWRRLFGGTDIYNKLIGFITKGKLFLSHKTGSMCCTLYKFGHIFSQFDEVN